jgi:NAD-dependent dihydropyrimidine dehydrogenase PreA subunit
MPYALHYLRTLRKHLRHGLCGRVPGGLYPWPYYKKDGSGQEVKEPGFDKTGKQLYINPEVCIDCDACVPACPVEAIFEESQVP